MPTSIPASLTKDLALTVYNDGFALVKEKRTIPPLSDDYIVHYLDVAQQIETDSILVKGLDISELNYEYDLVDKQKLLEKYVGRELKIVDPKTDVERAYRLLTASGGFVVEDLETGEIVLDPKGEVRLPELPDGLLLKPTLVWNVRKQTAKETEVSYLTRGISWEADYVMELRGNRFDLTGWVTLRNHSGMTYNNALLRLMAGTVSRVPSIQPMRAVFKQEQAEMLPEHQAFSDYHLYTIPGPITLKDNQQKQLKLLTANNASYNTIYEVREHQEHPSIYIEFANTSENSLGIPLPKGNVKMYRENPLKGTSEFIGEDRIDHTAVNEKVRLKSGEAFDITVYSGVVNEYKREGFDFEDVVYEIRNQKEEAAEMLIKHTPNGIYWTVEKSSHTWERKNGEIQIRLTVPAKTNVDVKFTIKYDRSIDVRVK